MYDEDNISSGELFLKFIILAETFDKGYLADDDATWFTDFSDKLKHDLQMSCRIFAQNIVVASFLPFNADEYNFFKTRYPNSYQMSEEQFIQTILQYEQTWQNGKKLTSYIDDYIDTLHHVGSLIILDKVQLLTELQSVNRSINFLVSRGASKVRFIQLI